MGWFAGLEHDPGQYHPEAPARLRAVLSALDGPDFARLERREAPEAALDDIARLHFPGDEFRFVNAFTKFGKLKIHVRSR